METLKGSDKMNKKTITIGILALILVGIVSAFSITPTPMPPIPSTDYQLSSIVFDTPMTEEGVVVSCVVTAINNDYHIEGGRAYCGIGGTNRFNIDVLIMWDYDIHRIQPQEFRVNYLVKNNLGEERFDEVIITRS